MASARAWSGARLSEPAPASTLPWQQARSAIARRRFTEAFISDLQKVWDELLGNEPPEPRRRTQVIDNDPDDHER